MLVARAGQIVTREEIRQEIWGGETYVDFDHGMNQCIKLIRTALCDNADHPVYVETLPRRGYRFLVAVVPGEAAEAAAAGGAPWTTGPRPSHETLHHASSDPKLVADFANPVAFTAGAAVPALAPEPDTEESPLDHVERVTTRKWTYLIAVALVLLLVTAGLLWHSQRAAVLTDKDTIVVAALTNYSSDPVLDEALALALQVELEQTPFLNLLAPDKLRGALKSLTRPEDSKLTPELARDVCLRSSSRAVIAPFIGDLGNGYRLRLVASDCRTGKELASVQMDAPSRDEVVKTLGAASLRLRSKLGEPDASLRQFNKPLEEATSSSLDALQAVARGHALRLQHGEIAKTVSELEHAIELDPRYADAYLQLGISYLNTVETELSSSNLKQAYNLRDRVTEKQRLAIETFYYTLVTGEWDKSINAYTQWTRLYPRDPTGFMDLSANLLPLGQYDRAAAAAQESLRLAPAAAAFVNLMQSYISLHRLEEASATFDEARAHQVDDPLLYLQRYNLAFLQQDAVTMEQLVRSAAGSPRLESRMLCADASTKSFHGKLREARDLGERALGSAKSANRILSAAECLVGEAQVESEFGSPERAKQLAMTALALSQERGVQTGAALALARAGDTITAGRIADDLNQKFPTDLMMQNYMLPTIQAALQLQKNNPMAAVKILQPTLPYENGFDYYGGFGALYPAYLRGEAYLKQRDGQSAAAEFQKLTNHPGIMANFATGALAYLQLGRALAIKGDVSAARQAYQSFLDYLKEADGDLHIVKEAQSEAAQLPHVTR